MFQMGWNHQLAIFLTIFVGFHTWNGMVERLIDCFGPIPSYKWWNRKPLEVHHLFTPVKPIYFRPFIGMIYNSIYNDRRGGHTLIDPFFDFPSIQNKIPWHCLPPKWPPDFFQVEQEESGFKNRCRFFLAKKESGQGGLWVFKGFCRR